MVAERPASVGAVSVAGGVVVERPVSEGGVVGASGVAAERASAPGGVPIDVAINVVRHLPPARRSSQHEDEAGDD